MINKKPTLIDKDIQTVSLNEYSVATKCKLVNCYGFNSLENIIHTKMMCFSS